MAVAGHARGLSVARGARALSNGAQTHPRVGFRRAVQPSSGAGGSVPSSVSR